MIKAMDFSAVTKKNICSLLFQEFNMLTKTQTFPPSHKNLGI